MFDSSLGKRSADKFDDIGAQCSKQSLSNNPEKRHERYKELLFMQPRPSDRLDVITYGECSSNLKIDLGYGNNFRLVERNLSNNELEQSINGANEILKPLKGRVAFYDKLLLLYVIIGFLGFGVIGFIFGFFLHWAFAIVIGILYFVILSIGVYYYKKWTTNMIIESHF